MSSSQMPLVTDYLPDDQLDEGVLLLADIQPDQKYSFFASLEVSAFRPLGGYIPFERPLNTLPASSIIDAEESGDFGWAELTPWLGTWTLAQVQEQAESLFVQAIDGVRKKYPQVLTVESLGLFARQLPTK